MKKFGILGILIVGMFMAGCASGAQNVTTIKDLSVVPAISSDTTQLEGIWRFVSNQGSSREGIIEYTFFGNQYICALTASNRRLFFASRGVINVHGDIIELYETSYWDFSYSISSNPLARAIEKDKPSIGLWESLPIAGRPVKQYTYTFTLDNNQLTIAAGKNSSVFIKADSQSLVLEELSPSYVATYYGVVLGENESLVVVKRQTAKEASNSRNSRINNDFQIRIDGNAVTTFGGGKENAFSIQADSVFGNDTETVIVVPNGNHSLDIYGKAGLGLGAGREYKSNGLEITASSSMVVIGAIWKGLILPDLIVEKGEELVYDEGLDRMVIRRSN